MILYADSGSTKTDWCLLDNDHLVRRETTQGINPVHQSEEEIRSIISEELNIPKDNVNEVRFYGAGCAGENREKIITILDSVFPNTKKDVGSDLIAAARAVCGDSEGIACILGTGANSGLYDGKNIISNTPPLGYILGDEGSGAVLGREFVNYLYKINTDKKLIQQVLDAQGIDYGQLIERVYRRQMANRFLASFVPILSKIVHDVNHPASKELQTMVIESFCEFFRLNVSHYRRRDLPVGFVGGVASEFREELKEAARKEGYVLGKIFKTPLDAIICNV